MKGKRREKQNGGCRGHGHNDCEMEANVESNNVCACSTDRFIVIVMQNNNNKCV